MAQLLPNEFTEIQLSEREELEAFASFTDMQLAVLRNFSAAAARQLLGLVFSGPGAEDAIREHAYHRGKVDLVSSILSNVGESRQQLAEARTEQSPD